MASAKLMHTTIEEHSRLFRDLLLGFVRVHVLYHASLAPVYGVGLITTLDEHGYRLSPGTLYPLLHSMEKAGFLRREDCIVGCRCERRDVLERRQRCATGDGQAVHSAARPGVARQNDERGSSVARPRRQ